MSDNQPKRLERIGMALRYLNDGLPSAPGMTARTIATYAMVLDGMPVSIIEQAVLRVLSEWDKATILPTPAVIRTAALEVLAEIDGIPSAAAAWAEVQQGISLYGVRGEPVDTGGYAPVSWSHAAVGRAVEAVGGIAYLSRNANTSADRAHWFRYIYPAVLEEWYDTAHNQMKLSAGRETAMLGEGGQEPYGWPT